MAALTGTQISVTYVGLLKTSASTVLSSTAQQITDGSGNNSILYLSTAEVGIGGSPTAGKELDVTGNVLITGDLQVDNININGNTISATSGVVTLSNGTIATTQSQNDNSTKVATTAYVDLAVDGVDTLAEVLANGNTTGGTDIAVSSNDDITFADSSKSIYGAGSDLQVYHDGSNSLILNDTGKLIIRNRADDQDIQFDCDNGSGGIETYFYLDGSAVNTRFPKDIKLNDSTKALFGGAGDLEIYHDGSNSYINETGTGVLSIQSDGTEVQINKGASEYMGRFITDAGVKLYYDNSLKFETTSSGIAVTGDADVSGTVYVGGNNSLFAENNLRFKSAGAAYIDHNTVGQSFVFRTSDVSSLDTTAMVIEDNGSIEMSGYGTEGAYLKSKGSFRIDIDNDNDHTDRSFIVSSNNAGSDLFTITETENATFKTQTLSLDSPSTAALIIDRAGTSNDAIVSWRNAGSEYFRAGIDTTDNNLWSLLHTCGSGLYFDGSNMTFGLGTSDPVKALHISASNPIIRLSDSDAGTASAINSWIEWYRGNNTERAGYIGYPSTSNSDFYVKNEISDGDVVLLAGDTERMRITSGGNLQMKNDTFLSWYTGAGTEVENIGIQASDANGTMKFYTEAVERMRITSDGSIYNSGSANSGDYNTKYGSGALDARTTGQQNTAFGRFAGTDLTTGSYNSFYGLNSGANLTTGAFNTALGFAALESQTTQSKAVAVGAYALHYATADNLTAVGYQALFNNTTGQYNTALGYQSLITNTTGQLNAALGMQAGYYQTGNYNTFIGAYSGIGSSGNSTASNNTALGYTAGQDITSGANNTLIGSDSGKNITSGQYNVSVGSGALVSATSAQLIIAIGYSALYSCTANDNVAIGYLAGQDVSTGTLNTMLGNYAGRNVTTASYGTYIGRTAGQNHTTGSEPFYIGYDAGQQVTTGNYNTAIGTSAMTYGNGTKNCFVGFHSGFGANGHTGNYNTALGADSLESINGGDYNTAIGYDAGSSTTTTSYSTFIGGLAGRDTTGANNCFVGALAGRNATSGTANTIVGSQAVDNNTFTAGNCTVVGFTAGQDLTSGANNTFIGSEAGHQTTTGEGQVAVGFEALKDCTTGSGNIAIGKKALENLTTGGSNTVIGYGAAGGAQVTGTANIIIGDAAGYNLTSGGNNILIGRNAGRTGSQTPQSMGGVATGSNVIHIGNESHSSALVQVSWTVNSDGRDKTDVKDLDLGLDFIDSLRPVTYRWDKRSRYNGEERTGEHKEKQLEVGLIAQEVIEQENKAGYNFEDDTNLFSWESEDKNKVGLQYEKLVPALINAIKELKQEIEILKSK